MKQLDNKRSHKGFTLMEMLIVVAIIAILVAIAVPIVSEQLEKTKETVCLANRQTLLRDMSYHYLLDSSFSQQDAEALKDSYAKICPVGGEIKVKVGKVFSVTCSIHGETSSDPTSSTIVSGLLEDYIDYVDNATHKNNDVLRNEFLKQYGGTWPTLTVDGQEYQIEPFYQDSASSTGTAANRTWLFARVQGTTKWFVPFVYNPQDGKWYQATKPSGQPGGAVSVTFKDIEALKASLNETHANGNPKWMEVDDYTVSR